MTNQEQGSRSGSCCSQANSFADRFEGLCRDVILPTLRHVAIQRARAGPSPVLFHVEDRPGRTAQTTDGGFNNNRRVVLGTTSNVGELSFIAWDPYVLVFSRRGCALSRHYLLKEITPALVEKTAHEFMSGIRLREPWPTPGR